MSDAWQRVDLWLTNNRQVGSWRQRARLAMRREVEAYRNVHVDIDAKELLALVDDAYPFGARSHHPYKAWLAERKILIEVLDATPALPVPTVEDHAACEVAIDLVEQGDLVGAQSLLDEQAPRRLNRECPVCGAAARNNCFEKVETIVQVLPKTTSHVGLAHREVKLEYRIVPHLSRVMPAKANGPLFGSRD